jgi:CheY-like chemotaxis protein
VFRILVVDDSPVDVFLLREALKAFVRPCQIDWVRDGPSALDFLGRSGVHVDAQRPHLILLDMNMPGMSGLETLRAIKSDPELSIIPAIMLSSSTSPSDVRLSYQSNANAYLQKPTSLENSARLLHAIEAFWMDLAVLPFDDMGAKTRVGSKHFSQHDTGRRHDGTVIAEETREERSYASNESACERIVSLSCRTGCEEYRRVLKEFGAAVHEVLRLHEEQLVAIVQGDDDSSRFDLLIHMANEKKQMAKYAYIRHVESHGCAKNNGIDETRT